MRSCFILCLLPSLVVQGFLWFQSKANSAVSSKTQLNMRRYPISNPHNSYIYKIEQILKRLNSKNISVQINEILCDPNIGIKESKEKINEIIQGLGHIPTETSLAPPPTRHVSISHLFIPLVVKEVHHPEEAQQEDDDELDYYSRGVSNRGGKQRRSSYKKSDHFEMNAEASIKFNDIGGYDNIKRELNQCIDIISNFTKYAKYNVRVPKGLVFEGPPGNGKTLFAKALAGEAVTNFISVSGSEFQDKYVGVGPSKVRELFSFARENVPCIIFIDEIDAVGRKRSHDGEASSSERDNTLNELLVALDGFKNSTGVFVIGATNRADLLDPALVRPGRIDKRIFITNPDPVTRKSIVEIHLNGKPHDKTVNIENLIEQTNGFSGAQIENLLNEAMLNALRHDRHEFTNTDTELVLNKMIAGWQPSEHQFTDNLIDKIAIHELGHAVVGMLCKHHSKMTKVIINLSAPKSPAYTIFENSPNNFLTREYLFEHLMILLSGRIAEETFYDISVTTGAINDFEEALKLAQKMVCYYGMGKNVIYPNLSDKYKEMIDVEVAGVIDEAYQQSKFIVHNFKDLIFEGAEILKRDKILTQETITDIIDKKYKYLFENINNIKFCK